MEPENSKSTLAGWSKAVRQIEGNKCAFCGCSKRIEAHHMIPRHIAPGLVLDLDNGIALCHYHHLCAHDGHYNPNSGTFGHYEQCDIDAVHAFIADYQSSRVIVRLPQGLKDIVAANAALYDGGSIDAFINRAIHEQMTRDALNSKTEE